MDTNLAILKKQLLMAQDKYFLTKAVRDKITYTEMKTLKYQEIKQL